MAVKQHSGSETLKDSIGSLNTLLRGELSAVETYRQAIEKLGSTPWVTELRRCQQSHERRAQLLREQIRQLGGDPSDSSGIWGAFAKLVEGSAKMFGDKAAIAALEEGEDHGLESYSTELPKLDPSSKQLVAGELLPEQQQSHDTVRGIQRSLE